MRVPFRLVQASHDGSGATEFFDVNRKKFPLLPEQDLMLAVLEDAIACYMNHLKPKSISSRALFEDAERWFFDAHGDWIFSFANICHTVGLDPNYVRRGLLSARQKIFGGRSAKLYRLKDQNLAAALRDCPQCAAMKRPSFAPEADHARPS
ncbi:MAG TPA: hypothetical protein VL754_09950 [Verrucomicrobiae bacterium]|jgi:hypothetical protein|nr:hypothetical protein [Verrucomicrobiae bacterium]